MDWVLWLRIGTSRCIDSFSVSSIFLFLMYHSFTAILNFATSLKEKCVKMWYCFYTQTLVFQFAAEAEINYCFTNCFCSAQLWSYFVIYSNIYCKKLDINRHLECNKIAHNYRLFCENLSEFWSLEQPVQSICKDEPEGASMDDSARISQMELWELESVGQLHDCEHWCW